MKVQILLTALTAATLFVGCSKNTESEIPAAGSDAIRASATVQNIDADAQVGTKAAVTEAKNLVVLVLTSSDKNDFNNYYSKGTMTFNGEAEARYDAPDFEGSNVLPADKSELHTLALYPASGWKISTPANTRMQLSFDGKQDIMTALPTTIAKGGTEVAAIELSHKLTKIDITTKASDIDAAAAWGAIQKIEITGRGGMASAQFPNTATFVIVKESDSDLPGKCTVEIGSSAPIVWPTYLAADGDTPFTSQTLALTTTTPATAAATTMMGAFTASGAETDLEISVTTKAASGLAIVTPIKVALPAGDTQGKQYTVNLTFRAKQIKGAATVTPWEVQAPIDKDVD